MSGYVGMVLVARNVLLGMSHKISDLETQLKSADSLAESVRDHYGWDIICKRAKKYIKARKSKWPLK